jgi:hypothetical protein
MESSKRYERERGTKTNIREKNERKKKKKKKKKIKSHEIVRSIRNTDQPTWIGRVAEDRGDEPSVTAQWVHPLFLLLLSGLFLRLGSTKSSSSFFFFIFLAAGSV